MSAIPFAAKTACTPTCAAVDGSLDEQEGSWTGVVLATRTAAITRPASSTWTSKKQTRLLVVAIKETPKCSRDE